MLFVAMLGSTSVAYLLVVRVPRVPGKWGYYTFRVNSLAWGLKKCPRNKSFRPQHLTAQFTLTLYTRRSGTG